MYWRIGLSHISKFIAKDTYSRAFNTTSNSFQLLGTNAYSFSNLIEFENMLQRIRQCNGDIKILLAHPHCNGLVEAATSRNCEKELYQNQGKFSIGRIIDLRNNMGLDIEIKLYNAKGIEELPIFRSMFLDRCFCITSIAVYGRIDHGKEFPQIFAKNLNNSEQSSKTLYNVVYRYFQSLWENSVLLSSDEETSYLDYYYQHVTV